MMERLLERESTRTDSTLAERQARANFSANLRALRHDHGDLVAEVGSFPTDVEWVYGRDGALTAMMSDGQWWAGCSLPMRAATYMLKKADLDGPVPCFLHPIHSAQIRVALDRTKPGQAILSLVPEMATLRMILACDDFSAEIEGHRLYFAAGEQWEAQLDRLLEALPGLPTPTQFIRPILVDSSSADAMISPAQKIFATHSNGRAERVRNLRQNWTSTGVRRVCVVAPSLFRLWDNAGEALADAMRTKAADVSLVRFNPDDPASASSAALAIAAASCDALVAPNTGRADLAELVPDEMPWATWVTTPRIPAADKAGPHDTLLLTDPEFKPLAIEKGWKPGQIFLAGWPKIPPGERQNSAAPGIFEFPSAPSLAIIADTQPLDAPKHVVEYSSHRLLWESIQHELLDNPFALTGTPDAYLGRHMQLANVEEQGMDKASFLDGLILHAWQQGIARLLIREKVPVKLFGKGWAELDDFAPFASGAVRTHAELSAALRDATALVHTWPTGGAHAIEAMGKPVIRVANRREAFIRDARLALGGKLPPPKERCEPLSAATVLRALRGGRQ